MAPVLQDETQTTQHSSDEFSLQNLMSNLTVVVLLRVYHQCIHHHDIYIDCSINVKYSLRRNNRRLLFGEFKYFKRQSYFEVKAVLTMKVP